MEQATVPVGQRAKNVIRSPRNPKNGKLLKGC